MKKYTYFLGADLSKKTIDFCLYNLNGEILIEEKVENDKPDIRSFLKKLKKEYSDFDSQTVLCCMENTGCYGNLLLQVLESQSIDSWVENPAHIKNSLGFLRGKNDKADARRIAEYGLRFKDKARLYKSKNELDSKLDSLFRLRQRLVHNKSSHSTALSSKGKFQSVEERKIYKSCYEPVIEEFNKQIAKLDKEIKELIKSQEELKKQMKILTSIPGIGMVNAISFIVLTERFTRFPSPKEFACFVSAAPFEHSSGTSVRGKTRTSKRGNRRAKALLHMAARAAVNCKNNRFKDFYERKIKEGKAKMSALNAVINKLIHCAFALIRKGEIYNPEFKHELSAKEA